MSLFLSGAVLGALALAMAFLVAINVKQSPPR
jgi:hypothetical protein